MSETFSPLAICTDITQGLSRTGGGERWKAISLLQEAFNSSSRPSQLHIGQETYSLKNFIGNRKKSLTERNRILSLLNLLPGFKVSPVYYSLFYPASTSIKS